LVVLATPQPGILAVRPLVVRVGAADLNPLIEPDGNYILVHWLDRPNLGSRGDGHPLQGCARRMGRWVVTDPGGRCLGMGGRLPSCCSCSPVSPVTCERPVEVDRSSEDGAFSPLPRRCSGPGLLLHPSVPARRERQRSHAPQRVSRYPQLGRVEASSGPRPGTPVLVRGHRTTTTALRLADTAPPLSRDHRLTQR